MEEIQFLIQNVDFKEYKTTLQRGNERKDPGKERENERKRLKDNYQRDLDR